MPSEVHAVMVAAEPPTLVTAVPSGNPGNTIPIRSGRTLRVIEVRDSPKPDGDPILVSKRLGPAAAVQEGGDTAELPVLRIWTVRGQPIFELVDLGLGLLRRLNHCRGPFPLVDEVL
jgi:hypothetical protein